MYLLSSLSGLVSVKWLFLLSVSWVFVIKVVPLNDSLLCDYTRDRRQVTTLQVIWNLCKENKEGSHASDILIWFVIYCVKSLWEIVKSSTQTLTQFENHVYIVYKNRKDEFWEWPLVYLHSWVRHQERIIPSSFQLMMSMTGCWPRSGWDLQTSTYTRQSHIFSGRIWYRRSLALPCSDNCLQFILFLR